MQFYSKLIVTTSMLSQTSNQNLHHTSFLTRKFTHATDVYKMVTLLAMTYHHLQSRTRIFNHISIVQWLCNVQMFEWNCISAASNLQQQIVDIGTW